MTDHPFKDPAMAAAVEELRAVMKKHDIMGGMVLCTKERAGWSHFMSPSWSCIIEDGEAVRVRSKRGDYESQEQQNEHLALSIGGIMGMLNTITQVHENLAKLVAFISTKVQINHVQSDMIVQRLKADFGSDDRKDEELSRAERVFLGLESCTCKDGVVDPDCPLAGEH